MSGKCRDPNCVICCRDIRMCITCNDVFHPIILWERIGTGKNQFDILNIIDGITSKGWVFRVE